MPAAAVDPFSPQASDFEEKTGERPAIEDVLDTSDRLPVALG